MTACFFHSLRASSLVSMSCGLLGISMFLIGGIPPIAIPLSQACFITSSTNLLTLKPVDCIRLTALYTSGISKFSSSRLNNLFFCLTKSSSGNSFVQYPPPVTVSQFLGGMTVGRYSGFNSSLKLFLFCIHSLVLAVCLIILVRLRLITSSPNSIIPVADCINSISLMPVCSFSSVVHSSHIATLSRLADSFSLRLLYA